jgi:integrase/recombinase XerC
MPNGRLEKETIAFKKIENKVDTLPKVFYEYYYTLRAEKKSYRTIGEYINSIKLFMDYVTKGNNTDDFYKKVSSIDINKYMVSLETKKVGGVTKPTSSSFRANQWYALNSFFEFLKESNKININPVPKKSRPKITDNPSVEYLTKKEIEDVIENIKVNAKEMFVNRDLCIFMLGITTGLRVAAITQIDLDDINFEKGTIRVIEKRNKSFDVMFGSNVKKILIDWICDRRKYFKDVNTNALFVSQFGKRISYDVVRDLLIKYADGITTKKVRPHVMRHTCATNLYEKTGDIYLTSAQLHHSNVATTQRYAEISDKSKERAMSILDELVKE